MALDEVSEASKQPLTCGLIMPISAIDGCTAEHWSDVKSIVIESIESIVSPKFIVKLVSDADDIGVIQKRIVQGVYNSDLVVCDVSGKNSNVMFELGLRLAFDKPTVIIKDDKTDYSFDTGVIEHIPYPRDLRFSKIVGFKALLAEKAAATYEASRRDPNHSTFLKNFGTFKVAHLDQKEASSDQLMVEMMQELQREMTYIRRSQYPRPRSSFRDNVLELTKLLLVMRTKDKSISFEPGDELVEKIASENLDLAKKYASRDLFVEALTDACRIAKVVL